MDDCNILELYDEGAVYSFHSILRNIEYSVTIKNKAKNISLVSYDIYIIGLNFFINNYHESMNFLIKS